MLTNYDFDDLTALLVSIRFNPYRDFYVEALDALTKYIEKNQFDTPVESSAVRHLLSKYVNFNDQLLAWVHNPCLFTGATRTIGGASTYLIIVKIFSTLLAVIYEKEYDRAVSLASASRNIPAILADYEGDEAKIRKKIAVEIKPYRNDFDKFFLQTELKAFPTK